MSQHPFLGSYSQKVMHHLNLDGTVFRIRGRRIRMFLGLLSLETDVRVPLENKLEKNVFV